MTTVHFHVHKALEGMFWPKANTPASTPTTPVTVQDGVTVKVSKVLLRCYSSEFGRG